MNHLFCCQHKADVASNKQRDNVQYLSVSACGFVTKLRLGRYTCRLYDATHVSSRFRDKIFPELQDAEIGRYRQKKQSVFKAKTKLRNTKSFQIIFLWRGKSKRSDTRISLFIRFLKVEN